MRAVQGEVQSLSANVKALEGKVEEAQAEAASARQQGNTSSDEDKFSLQTHQQDAERRASGYQTSTSDGDHYTEEENLAYIEELKVNADSPATKKLI